MPLETNRTPRITWEPGAEYSKPFASASGHKVCFRQPWPDSLTTQAYHADNATPFRTFETVWDAEDYADYALYRWEAR